MTTSTPAQMDSAADLLAVVKRGIGLIERVVTDPRLPNALTSLDDGAVRASANGGKYRAFLEQAGINVPDEVSVHLSIQDAETPSADSSAPHHTSYCFHYWHAEPTGPVVHHQFGVHHDSAGWHWGC